MKLHCAVLAGLLSSLACDRPADPSPQVKTPEATPAARKAPTPSLDEPSSGPVVAHIDGERVEGFRGWYENGVLTLYTGDDPNFDYGQKISFWHVPREPTGQRIVYPAPPGEIQHGNMSYAKQDPSVNLSTEWLEKFQYELRIGHEKDFTVEVSLSGHGKGPRRVQVNGTLTAMTAGIKVTDGTIDRSFDHLDTIQFLTRSWIKERHRSALIAERPDHCMMEQAPKKPSSKPRRQVAACSFLYRDDARESAIAKLWFEKQEGQWQEVTALEPEQLFRANPIKAPRDTTPWVFTPLAAQRFQETVYARGGGFLRISEPGLFPCGSAGKERNAGWCELTYSVYSSDREPGENGEHVCEVVTYVFGRDAEGDWDIVQTLTTDQKYNRKTRQIEPREQAPQHCG